MSEVIILIWHKRPLQVAFTTKLDKRQNNVRITIVSVSNCVQSLELLTHGSQRISLSLYHFSRGPWNGYKPINFGWTKVSDSQVSKLAAVKLHSSNTETFREITWNLVSNNSKKIWSQCVRQQMGTCLYNNAIVHQLRAIKWAVDAPVANLDDTF